MSGATDPPRPGGTLPPLAPTGGTGRDTFAADLASTRPTPGGGAAAARVGLYACSLLRMAAGITLEKLGDDAASGEGGLRAELAAIAEEARRLSGRFESLEDEDVAAFAAYLAALRLPRATPEEKERRRAARAGAAARATEAPLATLETARRTLDLAGRLLQLATRHPIKAESDVGAAIELAAAAFRTAELNVRVNLPEVAADRRAEFERRWQGLREPFEALYTKLRTTLGERLGP